MSAAIDNASVNRYNIDEVIKMYLTELLEKKNMSRYRLSKESGVAQATVADICSGKARIEKCSADTLYRIAKVLGVTIENLIEEEMETQAQHHRTSFDVYRSNVCHLVKEKGDIGFIEDVLVSDEIRKLYDKKWYAECFYLLAMIDYLSKKNGVPLCTRYNDLRNQKMPEIIYPASVVLMDEAMKTDTNRKDSLRTSRKRQQTKSGS